MSIVSEYAAVRQLLSARHPVIFYAENRHYYQYFKQLMADLLALGSPELIYITSDKSDPLLVSAPAGIKIFYVHWWLAFLFPRLKARVVVTSMTDLDNYAFKRSKETGCYVYIFHAAVSTHQQYTQKAFYNYDAIFATGRYQEAEIRAAEKLHLLPAKEIVHYGYPLIDALEEKITAHNKQHKTERPVILIAPSWFKGCIFDTCLEKLVKALSSIPCSIVIRPHPEYLKRRKKKFAALKKLTGGNASVSFDYSDDVMQSLLQAGILITDRSGIAFEYALGIGKPVLFIETEPKIMNAHWEELKIEPLENQLRSQMGVSVSIPEIDTIGKKIELLSSLQQSFPDKAALLKKECIFSGKASWQAGAAYIFARLQ